MERADAWFLWVYGHVAEPFAEVDVVASAAPVAGSDFDFVLAAPAADASEVAAPGAGRSQAGKVDGIREWLLSPGASACALAPSEKVRFLPPQSMVDLYSYHRACERDPVAYSTFLRTYQCKWKQTLRIRHSGMHSKCPDCEKYKELRRQATSVKDVETVTEKYCEHLKAQYNDRLVCSRIAALAESSLNGEVELDGSVLSVCMDGMDQAKFSVPRNLSMSKELCKLVRPRLHVTGAIVDGCLEAYFLNDASIAKDANLQATLLSRLLDLVQSNLQTKVAMPPMPQNLHVHSDNASGEGKNQTMMKLLSWMVWKGLFKTAEMSMFRVGHSHNKQDQRFAEVAEALARTQRLEALLLVTSGGERDAGVTVMGVGTGDELEGG